MTNEQKKMRTNGIIIAVLGIALSAAVLSPLYPLAKLFLNLAHWPLSTAPETPDASLRLTMAISGGLTAGIGAMLVSIAAHVMPIAPQAGRKVILQTAIVWFAVDSTFSIVAGSPMNAALNLIFLALMLGSLNFKEREATA